VDRGSGVLAPSREEVDLRETREVQAFLRRHRPRAVFNLAAARPDASEDALARVNAAGAEAVARGARAVGARLVHVSSDAVLDGRRAPYADHAPAVPLTAYGASKAEGERRVLAVLPEATVVRTSLIYDPDAMDRSTAGFAARLREGRPCPLYTDEIRCPVSRGELARALCDLVTLGWAGTLNVAGREAISRHDFALLLLDRFGIPGADHVQRVRMADLEAAGAPPRPRDLRLDVTKAERFLGRRLPGVRTVLGGPTPPGV
jgi:dTDP-4-dehydrorhamnose reductase